MDVIGIVGVAAGAVSIPLAAVAASTAVVSISQGVNSQQKGGAGSGADAEADKSDPRLAKFNLFAQCIPQASAGKHVHGKVAVLRKGKVSIDHTVDKLKILSMLPKSCILTPPTPNIGFSAMAIRFPDSISNIPLAKNLSGWSAPSHAIRLSSTGFTLTTTPSS